MAEGKKYHINPDTGKPNICNATEKRGCKYKAEDGTEPPHFPTSKAAHAHQNEKDESKYGAVSTMKKGGKSDKMDKIARELKIKVKENEEYNAALDARELELKNSIKDELEAIRRKRMDKAVEQVREAKHLLQEHGVDALTNPTSAAMIYEANDLEGNYAYDEIPRKEGRLHDRLTRVLPYSNLIRGCGGSVYPPEAESGPSVPVYKLSIPRGTDKDEIAKQAKALEPILKVQHQLNSNAHLGFMEDSLSQRGVYSIKVEDNGTYTAGITTYGSWYEKKNGTLEEAIGWMGDNATYGATAEYEAAHPSYDSDEDNRYYDSW